MYMFQVEVKLASIYYENFSLIELVEFGETKFYSLLLLALLRMRWNEMIAIKSLYKINNWTDLVFYISNTEKNDSRICHFTKWKINKTEIKRLNYEI